MEQAKGYHQEEDFEERKEDMGLGCSEQDEGKEGCKATIEHCRANIGQCVTNSLIQTSSLHHESMSCKMKLLV